MLFRARQKPSLFRRIANIIWPRIGLRRSGKYVAYRVARLPGTPYSIAAGFATGAAVSFTPLVGLHFLLGGVLAYLIRANVVASAIGTVLGNPWTFPAIWLWIYKVGRWIESFGNASLDTVANVDFWAVLGGLVPAMVAMDITFLTNEAWPLIRPMFIGAIPTMIFVWLAFYWPIKTLLIKYQQRRTRRREARVAAQQVLQVQE
tara:strand:- start:81 stop:692 length:612 start_codon:yes stop_codon:yes gene_type:complete